MSTTKLAKAVTKRSCNNRVKQVVSRYAAAAAAVTAAADASAQGFSTPYNVPAGTYTGQAAMTGSIGNWTGSFTTNIFTTSLTATNSPSSIGFSFFHSTFGIPTVGYDFTTSAQAAGTVSFTLSGLSTNFFASTATFIKNGIDEGSILANNSYNFAVGSGDVFGFRFTVAYGAFLAADISGFSAPVPEPSTFALWMGAGAVGLLGMRQSRRRKSVQH